jgi:hypothetical protein
MDIDNCMEDDSIDVVRSSDSSSVVGGKLEVVDMMVVEDGIFGAYVNY